MDEYLEAGLAKPGFEAEQAGLVLSELDDAVESGEGEAAEAVAGVLAGIERLLGGGTSSIYWLDLHSELEPIEGNEPESEAIKRTMLRLDSLLGILRGSLAEAGLASSVHVWLLAGRGWPLPDGSADELSQSNLQVPALLFSPGSLTGERRRQLLSLDDLLEGLFAEGERFLAVLDSDTAPGREWAAVRDGEGVSLRTAHWAYRFEGKHLLFRKPEDRFEVDDIASKYGDWCERAKAFTLLDVIELPEDLHQPTAE